MSTTHLKWKGLSDQDVLQSREEYGANVLTPPAREPWWKLLLEKFDDPVIRILLIAAGLSTLVGLAHGDFIEGIGIMVAVLLATVVAFLNEYKANAEFDLLNKVNDDVPVKAVRNGRFTAIPKRDIVVGDILLVETGEEIPADAEVLEATGFEIDEAKLTGESHPVSKLPQAEAGDAAGTYPAWQVLRSTLVADGHAVLRVTAVGDGTEIGSTARIAAEESEVVTPLNRQLAGLSKLIGVVAFAIAGAVFGALLVQDVLTGTLVLDRGQWALVGILLGAGLAMLAMIWLPVVFDALELFGRKRERPGWVEGGLLPWIVSLVLGGAVMAGGAWFLVSSGAIPAGIGQWLPPVALTEFLANFMIAVTVIVVAVPEGLALAVTLSLAYSMRKMIASNNLVRRMHACETIGAATVICSDKTGTLTMNQMRVGDTGFVAGTPERLNPASTIALAMAANSTANLHYDESGKPDAYLGNATEGALLFWLHDKGVGYLGIRESHPPVRQWAFSSERKFMATIVRVAGGAVLLVKGAPEFVLDRCTAWGEDRGPLDGRREALGDVLVGCQRRGMRTIGFACRLLSPGEEQAKEVDDVARDLAWVGFAAIADPVRPDVPDAIATCLRAGVAVKVVTGDNPETAREIARQIGLWHDADDAVPHAISTGVEFGTWSDEELDARADGLKILSRARPTDKLRLVKALQKRGHVVAVTGDGTNDAPALNHADVGLSMGRTGTSIAKEASDIILLDDSFTSIERAILWGRSIYLNIQHFLVFQLTINVVALTAALVGPFLGIKFPLTVIQMLWVNLIMDTLAALALATEPPDRRLMLKKPRRADAFIITRGMTGAIFGFGTLFVAALGWFMVDVLRGTPEGPELDRRLTLFFTAFIFLQIWNMFNAKVFGTGRSAFAKLGENRAFLLVAGAIALGQVAIVQFGGKFFRTVPLSLEDWALVIGTTSAVLWIGEIARLVGRLGRRRREKAHA